MIKNMTREKIEEDMFVVLKTIFHYERIITAKYGLNFEEIYALQYLRRNPSARVTDLSAELNLPMFTISRMVTRLVFEGFLSKKKDVDDKRNIHLKLEELGEKTLQGIESESYERITGNLAKIPEKKVGGFLNLADELHMVLGVTENVIK